MSANDLIMLNAVLEQKHSEAAPDLSESAYFEVFVAEQVLKDFDLSYDEILSGLTGGGGDGGIDSAYLFINGDLILEDTEFSGKKDVSIDVYFIQSKTSKSFSESQLDRFVSTTNDVLDLSKDIGGLHHVYNKKLLDTIKKFREAYKALASKFPTLRFLYYYATKGDLAHPNVERKIGQLRTSIKALFSSADFYFEFLGSPKLLELARQTPKTVYSIDLAENPISTMGVGGYICLVGMKDYYKFITDSKGKLIKNMFEANVRDYQGDIQVNEGIRSTLENKRENDDFWWLNNGVTIISTKATLSGKRITIENPQIVNGLQTSTEIHKYFDQKNTQGEKRNVLVRVLVPAEVEIRDRIIKATNSQTKIPDASLRATEKIHRDIEEYLRPHSLFYDRRKNFYKNEGKPIDKIISITKLAQAVMSTLLGRPDNARARPSSLLKKEEDYKRVFNHDYPLSLYLFCAKLLKKIDAFIKSDVAGLDAEQKNNIRFHLMMFVTMKIAKKVILAPKDFEELQVENISDECLSSCLDTVKSSFLSSGGTDQLAKGTNFVETLKKQLSP